MDKKKPPKVLVDLVNVNELLFKPGDPTRGELRSRVQVYEELLQRSPFVQLLRKADTEPSMEAAE
jgi:hypothetical protein